MVFSIGADYIAVWHDGDAFKSLCIDWNKVDRKLLEDCKYKRGTVESRNTYFEFSVTGAPASESFYENAVSGEHLDAVVTRISHDDVALVVHGYSSAQMEFNYYFSSAVQSVRQHVTWET